MDFANHTFIDIAYVLHTQVTAVNKAVGSQMVLKNYPLLLGFDLT